MSQEFEKKRENQFGAAVEEQSGVMLERMVESPKFYGAEFDYEVVMEEGCWQCVRRQHDSE